MKIYKSFDQYLKNQPSMESELLNSAHRPVLKLDKGQYFHEFPNFLIKIDEGTYEVGHPLITLDDYDNYKGLLTQVRLNVNEQSTTLEVNLNITEEKFDATQISEAKIQKKLQEKLEDCYDHSTADLITVLLGVFYELRSHKPSTVAFPLLKLPKCLEELSKDEARLPLVLTLDRRYQLRHHLEIITPKLRSQLNRVAEMMPLGRIQEMDAYCLRDYVRRPGQNAAEKAGARQELMGVQRFQNYNTPENKFLKGFCELLHLECQGCIAYNQSQRLQSTIDYFFQEPTVQTIQKKATLLDKPNYVLEQNAIYRSFYQAYLDYVHRRKDKEKIWGVRRRLAADIVAILVQASLLCLEGSYVKSSSSLTILDTPNFGSYIEGELAQIQCFLQSTAYLFQLTRQTSLSQGDWLLTIKKQEVNSSNFLVETINIFVFWYSPSEAIINTIAEKNSHAICFYFTNSSEKLEANRKHKQQPDSQANSQTIGLFQIPNPIQHDWQKCTLFVAEIIINCCGVFKK